MKKINMVFLTAIVICGLLYGSAFAIDDKLIQAAKAGNIKAMENLLNQGSDINARDKSGSTILILAASNGKYAAVKFLIDRGAAVDITDSKGNMPLHFLAASSKPEAIELMKLAINRGASVDSANFKSPRQYPAEIAISKGNIPGLELMIERGFGKDNYISGKPMVIFAYEAKQTKIMKFLADKGANLNAVNNVKDTLLHIAVQKNDMATVQYLIEKGAMLEMKGSLGRTPLFMAVEKGYFKIAEYLTGLKSDVNVSDNSGRNIMHILAAGKNNGTAIDKFAGYDIKINKTDSSGRTPLMTAINEKRWENIKSLVDAGADFTKPDSTGKSILVMAIENKNSAVASYLIEKGIDVRKKDTSGRTPLHAASALSGKAWDSIITLIIKKGGDVNVFDNTGVTAAGICIDAGNSSGFKILLDNGLDINLKEKTSDPIVLYAYKKKEKIIFTELAKRGADIKLKDGDGNSIIHLAAEKDDRAFLATLLPMNPDLNLKNKTGK